MKELFPLDSVKLQVTCVERVEDHQVLVHLERNKNANGYTYLGRGILKEAKVLMDWEDQPCLGEYLKVTIER